MAKPKPNLAKLEKKATKSKEKQAIQLRKGLPAKDVKLEAFLEEFMKNGGNATQAALVVFKPSSIEVAAVYGNRYQQKAKELTAAYLEKKGYGYGKMLDIATEKMADHKTPEWWDRLMKLAGYEDFLTKKPSNATAVVNVFQMQKKLQGEYGFAEEGEVIDVEPDKA